MQQNNSTNLLPYFSFGSNMSEAQMSDRCPGAEKIGTATVPGFHLVFNRWGDYRPGGVASIVQNDNNAPDVIGVVWKLSLENFKILDSKENPNSYERSAIKVCLLDSGKKIDCYTYVAKPQKGDIYPDREYLELIIDAAMQASLPCSYIKFLETFRTKAR